MTGPTGGDRCGWPQAILFDLDGTLVDSAPDIAASVNSLLVESDHAELSLAQVRSMIGNGIRKLVERAFAAQGVVLGPEALDAQFIRMLEIYGDHLTVLTVEMPSALDMVKAYAGAGVRIAVVTNKHEGFSRTILDALGFGPSIACVVGGDSGPERKPAPDMLLHACSEMGLHPSRALMVGDSPADIDAARSAGIASVAVHGGYTNVAVEELGADRVIASLAELPRAIEALKEPA